MHPNSREDLSALMDGELDAEPSRFLLRRIEREPELASQWSRWHLIRVCLNAGREGTAHDAHLAAAGGDDAFAARVLAAVQARPQTRRHWARLVGGGAIAASVAAAALILSVPQSTSTDSSIAAGGRSIASATATANTIASTAAPVRHSLAPPPWLNRQPNFLAARPAAANAILGGGALQAGYLQPVAYAPDANYPIVVRDPQQPVNAPYMIMLVPDASAAPKASHH